MEAYNVIRVIIVLISGMSIYFGYCLFKIVTQRQGSLKISGLESNLELSDVGPGIYFSLFGSIVLISVLWTQPYHERTSTTTFGEAGAEKEVVQVARGPASTEPEIELGVELNLDGVCIEENQREHYEYGLEILGFVSSNIEGQRFQLLDKELKSAVQSVLSIDISGVSFVTFVDSLQIKSDAETALVSYLAAYSLGYQCSTG